ncbi:MAG: glycerophosphodiester phosphodiesterase [Gemmatimonadales bacterium]
MHTHAIGHRGASGYDHENSPAAFRRAVTLGADGVELDIHATSDGVLLVHHDPVVHGVGRISALPASAFLDYRLPNGESIPALPEILVICQGMDVWVELKTLPPETDGVLLATLAAGPSPGCCAVHSFDHRIIARLGNQHPELRRGVLLSSYLLDVLPVLTGTGADTLWMETSFVDAELVNRLHSDGIELIAWTANDPREVDRLLGLGVDGICGNYPDRIRSAVESRPSA